MRNGSNFSSLNLFLEQALLLPWQLSYFKVREMCVNKAIILYISFVLNIPTLGTKQIQKFKLEIT